MPALKDRIRGVLGFPVTPFRPDLSLDLAALEQHVEFLASRPFCALVPAGGLGEVYSLTANEFESVVRVTVQVVGGRMPVIAGTGYNAALGADLAIRAERAGADGLLVFPPYYTNAPEEGLIEYYRSIGGATGLPLAVYSRDWAAFTPQQVARLAELIPALELWKDGQGDVRKLRRIMQYNGDRLGWLGGAGDDSVPSYAAIGVQGYNSSISVLSPRLSLALGQAGLERDFAALDRLMPRYVHPLYAIRERMRGYEVAAMKKGMEILGRSAGGVRPPLANCRPQDAGDLERLMALYREFEEEGEPGVGEERSYKGAGGSSR
jgi:5-dehydro-4-deoxyglucarate dehydratase